MVNRQKDALENIGFRGNINQFKGIYSDQIDYLRKNNILELGYKEIMFIYFLDLKQKRDDLTNIKTKKMRLGYKTFVKYLKEFVRGQNQYYEKIEHPKRIKLSGKLKTNKNNYYAYITILGEERKELAHSSKSIENIIKKKLAIFIDKGTEEISIIGGEKGIIQQLRFLIMRKNIKIKPVEIRNFPENFFSLFFADEEIKVYKIELENTEISVGDEVTIYSKNGEAKKYYNKFIELGILKKEDFGIYDLKRISFSYRDIGNYSLEFKWKKGFTKEIKLIAENKKELPKYIKDISNKENYWCSKLNNRKMLRILVYNGYIDLYSKSHNKVLTKLIENLELNKFLTASPVKGYRCERNCDLAYKPTNTKICALCGNINRIRTKYHKIELDFRKIIAKTGKSIKRGGFIQKYKTLGDNSFELETNPHIVRLEDKIGNYAYILFNENGLTREDIEKMRRYGLPFLVLNFKGELGQEFGKLITRDAGDLFLSIINKNFNPFIDSLKELSRHLYAIKLDAFEQSLKKIKSDSIFSPNDFEAIVFSFFNVMFPDCNKWGGSNVADGGCIFNSYKNEYLMWDAKRYNLSSLLNYVRNKLERKDLTYLKKFMKSELVKKNGKLKYYLYVTSNTKKPEFMQIKDEFKELTKKDRFLKNIELFCIDKKELIKLVEFFKKNQKVLLDKRRATFLTIIRNGFLKTDGYFFFENISNDLRNFVKSKRKTPSARELRKLK